MARGADPARINDARKAATQNRLIGTGIDEATAQAWIAGWEAQAALDGLEQGSAYWDAGWQWIEAQRGQRRRP